MDFRLPDVEGIGLANKLRTLPYLQDVPLIACTGFISQSDLDRQNLGSFNGYIIKPVEPTRLIQLVKEFLVLGRASKNQLGKGKRILIADDNAAQLKLTRLNLENLGYRVSTAGDGEEALAVAKQDPPDLILSDVLMPKMDGFKLTSTARQTPGLDKIPIILSSSSFIDAKDRTLAKNLGASDLVLRTPYLNEIIKAIEELIQSKEVAKPTIQSTPTNGEYQQRMIRQLEKQTAMNLQLTQQCSQQATALSVLGSISEGVLKEFGFEQSLPAVLAQCFDVIGISLGALYLKNSRGNLSLKAQVGYSTEFVVQTETFLNRPEVLTQCSNQKKCLSISLMKENSFPFTELLNLCNAQQVLLVPVRVQLETVGVLLMASRSIDLAHADWEILGQALGGQIGQAVALGNAVSQLAVSEKRYRSFMQNASDWFLILTPDGVILEANDRAVEIQCMKREKMIGQHFSIGVDTNQVDFARREFRKIDTEVKLNLLNLRLKSDTGIIAEVNFSATLVDLGHEKVVFVVVHDVTEQNRLESQFRQVQKMEAIGQLTGGIAHDFNNILAVIGLYTEALSSATDQSKVKMASDRIMQAQQKAAALTRQLLTFSRKQVIEPQVLNYNTILKDMKEMLGRIIGENIQLTFNCDPSLKDVFVDRGNLDQVIMNLLVNARDAYRSED